MLFSSFPTITRILLDKELLARFRKLKPGIVLDVGAKNAPYLNLIPYNKYLTLDIDRKNSPDIISDIHNIKWKGNYFDTVIATEVLEHLYNPQKAIDEIYRILKPGGCLILSTRFFYVYHPDPQDFYRYTKDSLKYLLRNFSSVKIIQHGNRIQVIWQILESSGFSIILKLFSPVIAKFTFSDPHFPLGFVVVAVK